MARVLLLLLVLSTHVSLAQQPRFTNLVMEGGGVRGLAYAGALEIMDSAGMLAPLQRVGGSSAGAIQAALLAVGYTPAELRNAVANLPLKQLNDGSLAGGYSRMKSRFGFYRGQAALLWIKGLIAAKTGDSSFTFGQLQAGKLTKGYKDLYVTGTDLNHRCLRVFSHETHPQMPIATALRISMAIPLYYEPVVLSPAGDLITTRPWPAQAHVMVDGGLLSNFPIALFDSSRFIQPDPPTNLAQFNPQTLGILLERPEEIGRPGDEHFAVPLTDLRSYVSAMYQTLVDKPLPADPESRRRTMMVSHLNISGRVRSLPPATVEALVESGRQSARRFLAAHHQPTQTVTTGQ